MSKYATILNARSLVVYANGKQYQLTCDHPNFNKAVEALQQEDDDLLLELVNPAKAVETAIEPHPYFRIDGGVVTYYGEEIHGYAITKLLEMHAAGLPITALVNFIVRVRENPSYRAINDLYAFLEYGGLPLLPDGRFVAYKRIREDWTDCHTGSISNHVGEIISMFRSQVDDNPNNTCSAGLHVCSYEYLAHFSGARCVAVAVCPEDVVSIPVDYDNTKMRVCSYEVLSEIEPPEVQNPWGSPVVTEYEPIEEEEEEEEEDELFEGEDEPLEEEDEELFGEEEESLWEQDVVPTGEQQNRQYDYLLARTPGWHRSTS